VIYYAADVYKSAGRGGSHATRLIKENTACTGGKEVPDNACSRKNKQGDTITLISCHGPTSVQNHEDSSR
jgi:hypothetical protein